jgi:hypothetical protein
MDFKKREIVSLLEKRDAWRKGQITTEQMLTEVATSKSIYQWAQLDYKITMQIETSPKSLKKALIKRGLIGDGMLIDISPEESAKETLYCEHQNKVISREQCKERTCDPRFHESCEGCDSEKTTRRLLVQTLEGKTFQ